MSADRILDHRAVGDADILLHQKLIAGTGDLLPALAFVDEGLASVVGPVAVEVDVIEAVGSSPQSGSGVVCIDLRQRELRSRQIRVMCAGAASTDVRAFTQVDD